MKKRWLIVLPAALMLAAAAVTLFLLVFHHPSPDTPAGHVIAHMGGGGSEYAEHSFEAYDFAISCGVTHLEQDVVVSKDGTLYACHDVSAKRLAGQDTFFAQMTDAEIEGITTVQGAKILKLEEILDRYRKNKDIVFIMELKNKAATDTLIDMVKDKNLQRRAIIQSVDLNALQTVKKALPFSKTLYLAKDPIDFQITLTQYYIDIISLQQAHLSKENVAAAHESGKLFNTWVCDTDEEIIRAIEAGADTYFTNYPKQAMMLEPYYRK